MPFGLTGAPTAFAGVTAVHLHDLIADETLEIFVDDAGAAADTFEDMVSKLTKILERVRERKLSLSATKSQLFMSEAIFAGARIGQRGVLPDLTKLTAVVDWKRPATALNLVSFLGLTGHFCDLVKGYARIEGPLRNLLNDVMLPQPCTKTTYRRVMGAHNLANLLRLFSSPYPDSIPDRLSNPKQPPRLLSMTDRTPTTSPPKILRRYPYRSPRLCLSIRHVTLDPL